MAFVFFRQMDSMDCGPTCLQMVAKHHGKYISLQLLREKVQLGKGGVNLLGISEAAEGLGFRTQAVKIDYRSLAEDAPLPCIVHWNQDHFAVLYKIKKSRHYVADPAKGLVTYTRSEFQTGWVSSGIAGENDGIALLLEPTPAFYELEEDNTGHTTATAFRNIFKYLLPFKKLIAQLLFGLAVASLLQLILPFLTQSVVDVGINTSNLQFIYIVLIGQIALVAGRICVDFVRGWILLYMSTRVNISILTDFLIKLMKLPVPFFDSKHTGDILQRMNDHQRIETFLTGASITVLFSTINLVIFSIVLAVYNMYIFTIFLSAAAIYSIWVILFLRRRRQLDNRRFEVAAREQSATIQLVQGMQEIKLNGIERPMRWGWERLQAKLFRLNIIGLGLNQWQQLGATAINEGKNIFITFLAARAVIRGEMTLGAMLSIQYILGQLNSPIDQMINFVQSWQNAKISMERLQEIHTVEEEEPVHKPFVRELPRDFARGLTGGGGMDLMTPNNTELMALEGWGGPEMPEGLSNGYERILLRDTNAEKCIHLQNVGFVYPGSGNEPVLNGIDLKIPIGKTTAIVGTSGSGKTTLLKLLLKFYEPQKGNIMIGNTSLTNISHRTWRSRCGVVMQDSYIFSDSILRNIAPGENNFDAKRLFRAIDAANIREFIESLPLGMGTKIGPEGIGVSMGQRQRILIARAVYRDPDFIFFDEATNSLDANNESVIVQNLDAFLRGKTVVVVAHRLSTVKNAEQIVVLSKGQIVERGNHQELVAMKGEYFTLIRNQLELGA
jgi:ATP-binding cassette subfamily B protein